MNDTKKPLIGLIHSTRLVVDPVHQVVASQCPDAEIINIVDEGILKVLFELGEINERITDWLGRLVDSAVGTGADMAVLSCSSLSPAVNDVREKVSIPFLKIDEPMAEQAVRTSDRIGLVATNHTTPKPSTMLIEEVAQKFGKKVTVVPRVQADAFLKLNDGDIDGHDNVVVQAVEELLQETDVVLLAQISIARVKDKLDEKTKARVYSSLDFIGPKINEILGKKI
ncbi:MAG: aspartate/glutamate racemase family protein [Deltaproteobacteria bacterium]|nr:aspartate/glutamate racemase family protein [Deltaproteobacteria bacterium]